MAQDELEQIGMPVEVTIGQPWVPSKYYGRSHATSDFADTRKREEQLSLARILALIISLL